jgi:hypothetical protein
MLQHLLNETIAARAPSSLLFLDLNEFKIPERAEDTAKIIFSDREMNITNVKAMKWSTIGRWLAPGCVARLAILFCFGLLHDNGNSVDLLTRQPKSFFN